jgi:hypothetical protein
MRIKHPMIPNDTDQAKRSALLDKISGLLAKTRENGCTESEAIAAAELAQKLMAKYGLSRTRGPGFTGMGGSTEPKTVAGVSTRAAA